MTVTEFPIFAYLGVHNNPNLEENYKQFKECGFNLTMWRFEDYDNDKQSGLKEACAMASKHGLGVVACTNNMYINPTEEAERLKDLEGFYGYYIVDEPTVSMIELYSENIIKPILSVDKSHMIYCNLLPYYDEGCLERMGVKTYREYLDESLPLNYTHISFDFYPVTTDGLRKEYWYKNLHEILQFSKDTRKNWWGFILSVPHICYPQPTIEHLRIQAYTNLAFGAQGLEYFTYQTPVNDPDYDFHNGPIDVDYKTVTNTWHIVKQMNEELQCVLPIFHNATDFNVYESRKCIFNSYIRCKDLPKNVKKIKVKGREGFIMSTFKNYDREYCMIVNSSYETSKELTFKTKKYKHINKENLTEEEITDYKYTLLPGNCEIFVKV